MTQGYSPSEIANELGRPASWVSERLASLRNELILTSGLFFPLTEAEYAALRSSIRRHGIRTPVIVGEHIACIDGRNRLLIAEELGLTGVPAVFLQGLEPEQERELAIALNASRRQINQAQRRQLIETELMRDPERSDRLIGTICGTDHKTVAATRTKIDQQLGAATTPGQDNPSGPVTNVTPATRTDRRGTVRTAPEPRETPTEGSRRLAYLTCTHGEIHGLYKDGDGYTLRVERDL